MGKITISMAIFNSYVSLPERISWLVILTILKNVRVNGKDDIPYMKWKRKNV
jgi:hypothetical protein